MNIGEMQRKLSLWAEQDKEHQFFDLYHLLYNMDWLRLAHDYVAQNAGSITAGCDGINMEAFDENLEDNLQQLAQALKSETFEACPVRRVYIPKPNGDYRPLGIPSIRDRIVQEALRMILEPIYEADFSQYSFGFRPNRCTMDAVKCITFSTQEHKKYFWVVEGDISSYFDTINHRRLVKILRRRIKDEKIIRLICKFLRAGVMERKLFKDTKLGTPQGGIISPLLANIYLHELDRWMAKNFTELPTNEKSRRRKKGVANFVYVRYADDFVVLSNGTKQQVEEFKEQLFVFLRDRLCLKLSKEKTKITHLDDGFDFLGFRIIRRLGGKGMSTKVLIPKKARLRFMSKVMTCLSPDTYEDSVGSKIMAVNRIIGGWCRYYQYTARASTTFNKLSHKVFWLMAHWLGRKFKLDMPQVLKQYRDGNSFAASEKLRLRMPGEFSTQIYRKRFIKPNPYTTQEAVMREELPHETYWTGYERRPGMTDLRIFVLKRDEYICQLCKKPVTADTAQVDHLRQVKFFKKPVDANYPDNLWTLCIPCHKWKTENDRKRESRVQ